MRNTDLGWLLHALPSKSENLHLPSRESDCFVGGHLDVEGRVV